MATVTEPVIAVRDAAVRFSLGRRHRSFRDWVIKGEGGLRTDEFWALDGVSFDVRAGEAIGVVGRNGQGKSTLLKLIAGVMLPDRGVVDVQGGVAPLIEITGGFVNDLTVRDNIGLTAGLHGMSKATIKDRFDEIVDFAEIEEFLDTPYKHLSSGMKVRVAFAVVSRLEEPIILVDEVLAVGDKVFKRKCYGRIDELIAAGRTLFLVSHSEKDLRRFCGRGLYLKKGRLVLDAPMEDVLTAYAGENGHDG
jgi:ABC-2 type transport system ATP-binding protein